MYILGKNKFYLCGEKYKFLYDSNNETIVEKNTFSNLKTLEKLTTWVYNIIILKDGRLSSSLYNG